MILHEDSELEATVALTEVLVYVCGLNVSVMDRDVPPGSVKSEHVLRIIREKQPAGCPGGKHGLHTATILYRSSRDASIYGDFASGREARAGDAAGTPVNASAPGAGPRLPDGRLGRYAETSRRHLQGLQFPRQRRRHGDGPSVKRISGGAECSKPFRRSLLADVSCRDLETSAASLAN